MDIFAIDLFEQGNGYIETADLQADTLSFLFLKGKGV